MAADIEKMYRRIHIAEKDQQYQHILWRENPSQQIKEYKLTTVTYGTAAAPFLAVRALQETAKNPDLEAKLREIIINDFYMDDLLTGGDTIEVCCQIYKELKEHLQKYSFKLRKWLTNSEQVALQFNSKGS